MRVLVIQLYGDYREAYQRLRGGADEYYYGQRYSVDVVAEVAKHADEVATLCGFTDGPYDELMEPGVRAIGAGFQSRPSDARLVQLAQTYDPTHVIIRTTSPAIFGWAVATRRPSIAVLAESLPAGGPRTSLRNRLIVHALRRDVISWVGAYGTTAAYDYARLGVPPDKIIPWDFLYERAPKFEVKQLRSAEPPWSLFYVGSLSEAKGVGDILNAIQHLKAEGATIRLKIAGNDADGAWAARAAALNLSDQVEFLGLVPSKALVPLMKEVDAVLVPSRHEYSEGFPLTIVHALESGSPVIASDHPMFRSQLTNSVNAAIFEAGNHVALAGSIRQLLSDPDLYQRISMSCEPTWKKLSLPVKFGDLVTRWTRDSVEDRAWLSEHRLASGLYSRPQGVSP